MRLRVSFGKLMLIVVLSLTLATILSTLVFLPGMLSHAFYVLTTDIRIIQFYPMIGLIPLMGHYAGYDGYLTHRSEVGHGSFGSSVYIDTTEKELPMYATMHSYETVLFQETPFDQSVKFAHAWYTENEAAEHTGAVVENVLENLLEHWVSGSAIERTTPFPVCAGLLNASIDDADQGEYIFSGRFGGKDGKFLEQGESIFAALVLQDLSGAPTTGIVHLISKVRIKIMCLSDREGARVRDEGSSMYVHIYGDPENFPNLLNWSPPVTGRVYNARFTLWNGYDQDNADWWVFDKQAQDYDVNDDEITLKKKPFLLWQSPINDPAIGGQNYLLVSTVYSKGPVYIFKGETMQLRGSEQRAFTLQFQFIADYDHLAEWSPEVEIANIQVQDVFIPIWIAPFDVYVTMAETEILWDSSSQIRTHVELMGIKDSSMLGDLNDFKEGWTSGDLHGALMGAESRTGSGTKTLDTLTMKSEAGTVGEQQSYEIIGDFYPKGSMLGIYIPDDFDTAVVEFDVFMHIEGKVRIKTRSTGTSYLHGTTVANLNEVSALV